MPDEGPIIELEPKDPFRWDVFLGLVAMWCVTLGLAIWLKAGVFRLIWPALLLAMVVYLLYCTWTILRRRR
ncbi:hypothetical protein ASA1KI_16750 [Opitutales bacterium ASA1]|jgi:hypothetical protein|uniref:hypothetical protein n=1 Tax=Congregicoccus parvus TaxID=3081749 RepID=UPI002B3068DB|nr:hypothetical protein ASA1KI_16750 [Opitutales bacterium ASA1]